LRLIKFYKVNRQNPIQNLSKTPYPFGMHMPGRAFSSESYRYGFNGKESDDEIKGDGNSLDFGARIYDSRLGRWLSVDPLMAKYPDLTPYNFVANSPIAFVDVDGEDLYIYGSVAEFNKFKALIEVEFDGLIKLQRDETGLVTMSLDYEKAQRAGVGLKGSQAMMNEQMNKVTYKVLNKAITHDKDTKLELVEGADRSGTLVGGFRGGTANGIRQKMDLADMNMFKDAVASSPLGAVVHEVEEAFQDQVVNISPSVTTQQQWRTAYSGPHQKGLVSQAKVDGFTQVANVLAIDASGNSVGTTIAEIQGANGSFTYVGTVSTVSNGNIINIKNYNITSVTKDSNGRITGGQLGTEIIR
jgi:RHS repeat-associated protein